MKIKSIHFQDVGPLGNQPISLVNDWDDSLEPRVLFSGPNGCGKSTVLRAVAMLWEALGYWLDHRKPLPKSHAAREWLQRWGGCAVVLHGVTADAPSPSQRSVAGSGSLGEPNGTTAVSKRSRTWGT